MKAIVIGATGATGMDLVKTLNDNPNYSEVVTFVRRKSKIVYPKVIEILTDFDNLEPVSDQITGDVLFSCLGTTRAAAGSQTNQWHIDYEIPAQFAQIARSNGVRTVVLLSAYNASPESNVPYSKMKGTLEQHLTNLEFSKLIIFRPGFLQRKNSNRIGERMVTIVLNVLNTIGVLRAFKPLPTALLAQKMAKAPTVLYNGTHILELNKIFHF